MLQNDEIGQKILRVFKKVFNDENLQIKSESSSFDIEGWDSLVNVEIFFSIEQEFGIQFSPPEVLSIKNVGELYLAIKHKLMGSSFDKSE